MQGVPFIAERPQLAPLSSFLIRVSKYTIFLHFGVYIGILLIIWQPYGIT